MQKILYIIVLCLSCSFAWASEVDTAMKELSKKVISSYQKLPGDKGIKNVGVLDFENKSMLAVRNNLGVAFSEMLSQHLIRYHDSMRIIERKALGSILREKELKMTGIASGSDASSYGEVLGADLLIMGSVLESGVSVRVNVRVVETAKSQVVLSESIDINKNAFVEKAQRFVKVTHSISAGYMYQFIDEFRVNTGYIMYNYNFFYGLALGFQLFVGISDSIRYEQQDTVGMDTYTSRYDKSFKQAGLNILFSKSFDIYGGFELTPFAGPSMFLYMDESKMIYLKSSAFPAYDLKPSTLSPSNFLFGVKAGLSLDYRFTPSYRLFIGGEYQYFPDFEIIKSFGWKLKDGSIPSSTPTIFTWYDKGILSGYSVLAGVSYSF